MPVLDTDIHVAKDMFEVNYFGVLRVTQEFSALVIAARGKIINISSIVGEFPNSFTSKTIDYPLIPGSARQALTRKRRFLQRQQGSSQLAQ